MKTRLEVVLLSDIVISITNPRKTFDQKDTEELAESIKENGVLQPILIRPINTDGAEAWIDLTDPQAQLRDRSPRFMLVCGERRYRASLLAGVEDIPANIRELTDDQAFELQIIENLQRKDVHPLEEAEAYKAMLDTGRYTIPDVAAKMAKPQSFIEQRLKLNDLIPEIKQDFLHNELSIGHAIEIARLTEELQEGLLKNYKNRYNVSGWGTHAQLKIEINTQSYDLAKAQFDIAIGYGNIGACAGCAHRSATNPILFADMQTDSCFNKACYHSKTEASIALKAAELIASGDKVLLARPKYNDAPKAVLDVAEKQNVPIITDYQGWQGANTVKQKVFHVAGSKAGQMEEVWVPKTKVRQDPSTEAGIKEEIARIEERATRALELDQEKIFAAIVNAMKGNFLKSKIPNYKLDPLFVDAMLFYIAISTEGYYAKDDIRKITNGVAMDAKTPEDVMEIYNKITPDQRKRLMVLIAFRKYSSTGSPLSFEGKVIRMFAESNPDINVAGIVADQNDKAFTRIARTEERLAELRKKLDKPAKKESKKKGLAALLEDPAN